MTPATSQPAGAGSLPAAGRLNWRAHRPDQRIGIARAGPLMAQCQAEPGAITAQAQLKMGSVQQRNRKRNDGDRVGCLRARALKGTPALA